MKRIFATAALGAGLIVAPGWAPGWAQDYSSVYVDRDAEGACRVVEQSGEDDPFYRVQACNGPAGWVMHYDISEHGESSAYTGPAGGTPNFEAPGAPGNFGGFMNIVEWRLADGAPIAVIHRYRSNVMNDETGEWRPWDTLVVTALRDGEAVPSCQMALVDATVLENANSLARDAAERFNPVWGSCQGQFPYYLDRTAPTVEAAHRAGPG